MMLNTKKNGIAALALLALACGGIPGQAMAQEDDAAAEAEAPQGIPWDTSCTQLARADEPDCEMSQIVIVPQSRQVLLRIEIEVPGDGSGTRMVLRLPHGLYLPDGVTLDVDESAWRDTEVQTCDGQGCYAFFPLDEDGLRRLRRGNELGVSVRSLSREPMRIPVNLEGFTEAYGKIR